MALVKGLYRVSISIDKTSEHLSLILHSDLVNIPYLWLPIRRRTATFHPPMQMRVEAGISQPTSRKPTTISWTFSRSLVYSSNNDFIHTGKSGYK